MRFARITLGLLLTLAGVLATVAGAVAAFWLVGPDNTISTPSRALASKGLAVLTAPDLLDRHGPILHVTASGLKPLFVGVARDLDARDYLSGTAHTRLIRFDPPATFGTQDLRGRTGKLTPPGELDWWVAKSAPGSQSLVWPTQDGRYDVVVMNADGSATVGAQVSFGIEVHRLFGICLLVLGAGILVLALGIGLTFRRGGTTATARSAAVTAGFPAASAVPAISRIATLVTTAPAPVVSTSDKQTAATVTLPPDRVSPFAPERVSPFLPTQPATARGARTQGASPQSATTPGASTQGGRTQGSRTQAVSSQPATTQGAAIHGGSVQPAAEQTKPARTTPIRPAATVPAAPMFMTPAAVAR